ncbi:nickel-dependent hydrogenase large subunit [Varibaculum cambriense]|uniref:nickel-dependent hydrogenase large subunit n=1 Tax=Varibaculum cambriense TaxID=184870 RepID=UPI00241D9D4B|nr:nickel-dependent hydrogenase large subunit [Varibaculum cambriense]MBS5944363.1 nickel-dependent hydrogenase large subunit [Varibaculum cambriense]
MKINLDEIIDPLEGRVVVSPDSQGQAHARFDLQGLPRIDGMLVGKSALEALKMTEHLCGICPVAHHLAGIRALDTLSDSAQLSRAAELTRRLLHYGSVVETHSLRFLRQDRDSGITLKKISKKMLVAAGSPGHFPTTAVPGGVRNWPNIEDLKTLQKDLSGALTSAEKLCELALNIQPKTAVFSQFAGIDLALINEDGDPDIFGNRVRAARAGSTWIEFDFSQWKQQITEDNPGAPAPRPYLTGLGSKEGGYRVGPVAQLSVGLLPSELASAAQVRWLAASRDAASARAIITLHVLERTVALVSELIDLLAPGQLEDCPPVEQACFKEGVATGLVDGPRGLLAHTYRTDSQGVISAATILTPTAQNEPWLADLLTQAISRKDASRQAVLEQSIREADPCLPLSSAPEGQMGLTVDTLQN